MGYTGLVIPGISCYVKGSLYRDFVIPVCRYIQGYVILEDFTANTAIHCMILGIPAFLGLDATLGPVTWR